MKNAAISQSQCQPFAISFSDAMEFPVCLTFALCQSKMSFICDTVAWAPSIWMMMWVRRASNGDWEVACATTDGRKRVHRRSRTLYWLIYHWTSFCRVVAINKRNESFMGPAMAWMWPVSWLCSLARIRHQQKWIEIKVRMWKVVCVADDA